MPGPVLPNTGIQIPALGGDAGTWDILTNACWTNYDSHDHSAGKGVKVPIAGINVNADFPLGGFGATGVGRVAFAEVAALSSGADTIFVNSSDHELYWRTAGGVNVKLTAGNSINTSLVGGILGDYSTVGAQFSYDDANTQYLAKTKTPNNWAYVHSGGVRLAQAGTTSALYTALLSNAGIASSFNITLPSALPGSTSFVMMDASGNLSTTTSPSATTYRYSTALAKAIPACEADLNGGARITGGVSNGMTGAVINGSFITFPLNLNAGDVVNSYVVYIKKVTSNATTVHGQIFSVDLTTGNEAAVGTGCSNNGNADGFHAPFEVLTLTADSTHAYYIVVWETGGGTSDQVFAVQPSITHP